MCKTTVDAGEVIKGCLLTTVSVVGRVVSGLSCTWPSSALVLGAAHVTRAPFCGLGIARGTGCLFLNALNVLLLLFLGGNLPLTVMDYYSALIHTRVAI